MYIVFMLHTRQYFLLRESFFFPFLPFWNYLDILVIALKKTIIYFVVHTVALCRKNPSSLFLYLSHSLSLLLIVIVTNRVLCHSFVMCTCSFVSFFSLWSQLPEREKKTIKKNSSFGSASGYIFFLPLFFFKIFCLLLWLFCFVFFDSTHLQFIENCSRKDPRGVAV